MLSITQFTQQAHPVLPVMVIEQLADAVPLASALAAGGIKVFEITLRTSCALDAINAIKAALPDACVGAGTVCDANQLTAAIDAGSDFVISPGFTEPLARAAELNDCLLIPGVCTPSEVMQARDCGLSLLKLFPAAAAGGTAMLKALQGPFAELKFCPTGGISASNATEYLALDNVACVGGSWLCPADRINAADWPAITALAQQACQLR